jgi:hypothetical protein
MLSAMDGSDAMLSAHSSSSSSSTLSLEDFSDFLISVDQKFPLQCSKDDYAKYFSIEQTIKIAPGLDHSLLSISNDQNAVKIYLRDVALYVIEKNVQSEKKSELSAMIELCRHFQISHELKSQVSFVFMCYD